MSEPIISKQCRICKEIKPISEFYKNPETKDLHFSKCKTCCAKYRIQYRKTEKGKATRKRYIQSEKGKATRKHYAQSKIGKTQKKAYSQSKEGKVAKKRYAQSEKGKAANKYHRQTKKGKKTRIDAIRRFNIRNPVQLKAHDAVNIAIRKGQLPRPDSLQCQYCPAQAKEYHHYKSYAPEHWLDVVPVCIPCHNKIPKSKVISATV